MRRLLTTENQFKYMLERTDQALDAIETNNIETAIDKLDALYKFIQSRLDKIEDNEQAAYSLSNVKNLIEFKQAV